MLNKVEIDFNNDDIVKEMLKKASEAKLSAYVKYSGLPVEVSILTKDGNISTGFNIEHSSYSLAVCAEKAAIIALLIQGYNPSDISKILILGDTDTHISPCGACREFISEFSSNNVEILLASKSEKIIKTSIDDLLPN